MNLINRIIISLGAIIGIILGPLYYIYQTNPSISQETLYFIGANRTGIVVAGIGVSITYMLSARLLITYKVIESNESSLRNTAISVGIINAVSTMLTILPNIIL